MNNVGAILIVGAWVGMVIAISGYYLNNVLWALQSTLAKLPTHLNERKEIVIPPHEEARQGDVVFHIPTSLYGDRS